VYVHVYVLFLRHRYIPPVYDLATGVYGNQLLFEEDMALSLDVGAGDKLLDLGCGRGRIAHHVARLTGAKVMGLNIGEDQVANAKEYAASTGMGDQLEFVLGSYNDPLPFPDNTFDGMYQVQALTYVRDLDAVFAELARVLKPGAKLSFLDWFKLEAYDERNQTHAQLLRKTKAIIGAVYTPTAQEYIDALVRAGFQVEFSKEASITGHQFPLIQQARDFFMPVGTAVNALVRVGLLDESTATLLNRLNLFVDDFIESDRLGLFTTSWWIVAQKPPVGPRRR
jgi:sterol 24-C-methyltransferase